MLATHTGTTAPEPLHLPLPPKRRRHLRILQQIKRRCLLRPDRGNGLGYVGLDYQYQSLPGLLAMFEEGFPLATHFGFEEPT